MKRSRSQFRRLRFGQPYWLATNVATAPSIKYDNTNLLNGYGSDGSPTLSAVSPTNVAVIKVPQQFDKLGSWRG